MEISLNCLFESIIPHSIKLKNRELAKHSTHIEVYFSEDKIPSSWSQITGRSIFIQQGYLRAFEAAHIQNIKPIYCLIKEDGETVGAAQYHLVNFKGEGLRPYLPQEKNQTLSHIAEKTIMKWNWNLLISGNIFISGDYGFSFKTEIPRNRKLNLLSIAANYISDHFPDLNVQGILLTDLPETALGNDKDLLNHGYSRFEVESNMVMDIRSEWNSIQDYMKDISSKYRVRTKKVLKDSKNISRKTLSLEEMIENRAEIDRLYNNVVDNIKFQMGIVNSEYFIGLKRELNDQFEFDFYLLDGKNIGFISRFKHDNEIEVHLIGLEYEYLRSHKLYNRILYDQLEVAIEQKADKLIYGRTANEIKSTVGAEGVPLYCYLKHVCTIPNLIVGPFTKLFKPDEWVRRNPFKN